MAFSSEDSLGDVRGRGLAGLWDAMQHYDVAIQENAPMPARISSTIVPVYDVDFVTCHAMALEVTVPVASATWIVIGTVPDGEIWQVSSLETEVVTGVYTFTAIGARNLRRHASHIAVLDRFAATTGPVQMKVQPSPMRLDPGSEFLVYVDSHTTTGTQRTSLWVTVYDVTGTTQ